MTLKSQDRIANEVTAEVYEHLNIESQEVIVRCLERQKLRESFAEEYQTFQMELSEVILQRRKELEKRSKNKLLKESSLSAGNTSPRSLEWAEVKEMTKEETLQCFFFM